MPNNPQYSAAITFHDSCLVACRALRQAASNSSRFRPDYIAARLSVSGTVEFALVESKGTSSALNNMHTWPTAWARQVRNAIVTVNGSPVIIPRHLIVATRCNPNAARSRSRQIQVRAWNSYSDTTSHDMDVLLEIASVHYAGLCRNLGLRANLRAFQLGTDTLISLTSWSSMQAVGRREAHG